MYIRHIKQFPVTGILIIFLFCQELWLGKICQTYQTVSCYWDSNNISIFIVQNISHKASISKPNSTKRNLSRVVPWTTICSWLQNFTHKYFSIVGPSHILSENKKIYLVFNNANPCLDSQHHRPHAFGSGQFSHIRLLFPPFLCVKPKKH